MLPDRRLACLLAQYNAGSRQPMGYSKLLGAEYALRMSRQEAGIEVPVNPEDFEAQSTALHGPFQSFNFEAFLGTGSPIWRDAFVQTALKPFHADRPRSAEGAWLHPGGKWVGGHAILMDSFQEEASKAIKLAWLLNEGRASAPMSALDLEMAALEQFEIHREILRCPTTGLWHNGRDWLPGELSPGYWSRGHGWLLRGLTESLFYAREPVVIARLTCILREVAEALLAVQRPDGLWRAILHLSDVESPPETSGSAMIAAGLLRGITLGVLVDESIEERALHCARTLMETCFSNEGTVLGACRGPGPLISLEEYLCPCDFPPNEPHGVSALLMLLNELAHHSARA